MRAICAVAVLAITVGVSAQEGTVTLRRNYQVQFENAWVKVTAVRYGPNEKLPGHTHTPNPSAYVYLNDGGPVIFRHVGGPAATRAATRAGAFRVYRGAPLIGIIEPGPIADRFSSFRPQDEADRRDRPELRRRRLDWPAGRMV